MAKLPVRLGPAEELLISQMKHVGANDAAAAFETVGLPTRRVESYHYTDLKSLLRVVPELSSVAASTGEAALELPGAYRLAIVNGAVQAATAAPAGVSVSTSGTSALSQRDDVLVRLNKALAKECLDVALSGDISEIIYIDRRIDGDAAHVADAAGITIADDTKVVIVESFSGSDAAHLANHSTKIDIGRNCEVTHVCVDLYAETVRSMPTAEYVIGADVKLRTLVVCPGAVLSRTQVFAKFAGEGSHADFSGLSLVDSGQHNDITLDITHAVPNTTSTETYKTVARGRGRGVFQGKINVVKDAQKTDAAMMAQGLLLSEEAEIFSKPELEIFADDVVCGHGATCGALDDASLFYLMSRGIEKAEAQAMLIRGFLDELFDPIEDENLQAALSAIAENWLQNGMSKAS